MFAGFDAVLYDGTKLRLVRLRCSHYGIASRHHFLEQVLLMYMCIYNMEVTTRNASNLALAKHEPPDGSIVHCGA